MNRFDPTTIFAKTLPVIQRSFCVLSRGVPSLLLLTTVPLCFPFPLLLVCAQLTVSVYHPLLFGALYKLIRAKCFNCHNFRLSKSKTRLAAVKVRV